MLHIHDWLVFTLLDHAHAPGWNPESGRDACEESVQIEFWHSSESQFERFIFFDVSVIRLHCIRKDGIAILHALLEEKIKL